LSSKCCGGKCGDYECGGGCWGYGRTQRIENGRKGVIKEEVGVLRVLNADWEGENEVK